MNFLFFVQEVKYKKKNTFLFRRRGGRRWNWVEKEKVKKGEAEELRDGEGGEVEGVGR